MATEPESAENTPRSLRIARRGVYTARDVRNVMSALMVDLLGGAVTHGIGNAVVNASGKMMKAAELEHKYGTNGGTRRDLELADREVLEAAVDVTPDLKKIA